jgi:hypothetical protein
VCSFVSLNDILIFAAEVLGAHNADAGVLASGEGVAEDHKMLLNYLEHVCAELMLSFSLWQYI